LTLDPGALVFGEDVAKKGGVYGVSKVCSSVSARSASGTRARRADHLGRRARRRHARALTDPEIQYLAYLHNAEDQLRGEAASMQFFSDGK